MNIEEMKCPKCHSTRVSIRKLTAVRRDRETSSNAILRCMSGCGTFTFSERATDAEKSSLDPDASGAGGALGADEDLHKCPRCGRLTVGRYWNGIMHRWCRRCAGEIL